MSSSKPKPLPPIMELQRYNQKRKPPNLYTRMCHPFETPSSQLVSSQGPLPQPSSRQTRETGEEGYWSHTDWYTDGLFLSHCTISLSKGVFFRTESSIGVPTILGMLLNIHILSFGHGLCGCFSWRQNDTTFKFQTMFLLPLWDCETYHPGQHESDGPWPINTFSWWLLNLGIERSYIR